MRIHVFSRELPYIPSTEVTYWSRYTYIDALYFAFPGSPDEAFEESDVVVEGQVSSCSSNRGAVARNGVGAIPFCDSCTQDFSGSTLRAIYLHYFHFLCIETWNSIEFAE